LKKRPRDSILGFFEEEAAAFLENGVRPTLLNASASACFFQSLLNFSSNSFCKMAEMQHFRVFNTTAAVTLENGVRLRLL
jgi:hypothetical protein